MPRPDLSGVLAQDWSAHRQGELLVAAAVPVALDKGTPRYRPRPIQSTLPEPPVKPLRVFLVEDVQNMQILIQDLLATLGQATVAGCANTEAEALFWLEQPSSQWDVLILDLVLAQGSGISLIARARQANPAAKIAVFSGYASPGITAHCLRLGADAVFDKASTEPFVQWLYELQWKSREPP